jgi:predicted membrane protein DUF2157
MLEGERHDVVPIGTELRALAWSGVMLIVAGVGIVIRKHFDQIGPLAIAVIIGAAAVFCYVWVALKKRAPLDDYVVLLGALLISADVGFIETQWKLLGDEWQRHFLLLAVLHAVAAYFFDSRAVLSLSIVALAAWLGIEQREVFIRSQVELAIRAFICAGIVAIWRIFDRRFHTLLEHFGANFAFWGALILTGEKDTRWLGLLLTMLFAGLSLYHGVRRSRELFVIYAVVYGLIAIDIVVLDHLRGEIAASSYLVVSTIAAIGALIAIHFRFRRGTA